MPEHGRAFSRTTRGELRDLLAGRPAAATVRTIGMLELAVSDWQVSRRVHQEGDDQDRADLVWLRRLVRELETGCREFERLAREFEAVRQGEATPPPSAPAAPPLRAGHLLAVALSAVRTELGLRRSRAGRNPRFVLDLDLTLALRDNGIPLTKSRSGLAHRIFVVVYAELGLSREGDVFHALKRGIDMVRRGAHFRVSPAARQVLQPRRKRA